MKHYHSAIWIDHHEARVFNFNAEDVDELTIRPDNPNVHLHCKAGTRDGSRAAEDRDESKLSIIRPTPPSWPTRVDISALPTACFRNDKSRLFGYPRSHRCSNV
jgi:hypothetical protein